MTLTRRVLGHLRSKFIVLIESPWLLSHLTSFDSNIAYLTIFKIFDIKAIFDRINGKSWFHFLFGRHGYSRFPPKTQVMTSPGTLPLWQIWWKSVKIATWFAYDKHWMTHWLSHTQTDLIICLMLLMHWVDKKFDFGITKLTWYVVGDF